MKQRTAKSSKAGEVSIGAICGTHPMDEAVRRCNFQFGQDETKREKDYAIDSKENGVGGWFGGVRGVDGYGVYEHG